VPLVIDPVITYSTYLGGSGDDFPVWSDIDRAGTFYVTGSTSSTDFPTTGKAFQGSFGGGDGDAFVAKLNRSGSGLVWSTYLGGDNVDVGIGLDVDRHGNVVVTGETASTGFLTTPGAFQPTFAGGPTDAFVTKLNAKGSGLLFSTFLGGQGAKGSTPASSRSSTAPATSTWRATAAPQTFPPPRGRSSPASAAGRATPGRPS
jgi:hypothetical protein